LPSVGPSTSRRRAFVLVADGALAPIEAVVAEDPGLAPIEAVVAEDPGLAPIEAVVSPDATFFFSRGCGAVRATTTLLPSISVARVY
jgi:hypothetical protein